MKKIQFNFSPSLIGQYNGSELMFYFQKILKQKPDTNVVQVYGLAGNIVHDCIEDYINGVSSEQVLEKFEQEWSDKKLDHLRGLNGKPLNKNDYLRSVKRGLYLLDNKYVKEGSVAEEQFIFPFKKEVRKVPSDNGSEDVEFSCKIKGYADCQTVLKETGETVLVDWKTSSSVDKTFRNQAQHYLYSMWRTTGKLVTKAIFEYVKINKSSVFEFSEDEIKNYDKLVIEPLYEEIVSKGLLVDNYSLGDIDSIFNAFKFACYKEKDRRSSVNNFNIIIKGNRLILSDLSNSKWSNLIKAIDLKYKYRVDGCEFSPKFQNKIWDGMKRFLNKKRGVYSLPVGFKSDFEKFFAEYCKHFNLKSRIVYVDDRDFGVLYRGFKDDFGPSPFPLRDYQEEAVKKAYEHKIGILHMSTGSGKTLTSAEFIKRTNVRTLFVVNRNELAKQTKKEYESYLGVEIGLMTKGVLDVKKKITVASVQTMNSIMNYKGKDEERLKNKKILKTYLYNVQCLILDEAQFVSDINTFGVVNDYCENAMYRIGLSATPFRSGSDTLELNAVIGFPIFTYDMKKAEKDGYLVPTDVFFYDVNCDVVNDKVYSSAYDAAISENRTRNKAISQLCSKFYDSKILLSTKKVSHGEDLYDLLKTKDDRKVFLINGSTSDADRDSILKSFKESSNAVLIGTGSIIGTGLDIPSAEVVINACANASDIFTVQFVGRVKRLYPDKTKSIYIDFIDNHNHFTKKASKSRQKILKQIGHEVCIERYILQNK